MSEKNQCEAKAPNLRTRCTQRYPPSNVKGIKESSQTGGRLGVAVAGDFRSHAFFAWRGLSQRQPRQVANPAGPCYSDLRASTGSLLLAELAGMRPAMSVSSTEMPMSTRALVHGRLMMLGTWWVLST